MRGTIRAKGHCRHCGEPWPKNTLLCGCGRWPARGIYIDLSWGKPAERIKVYSDRRGAAFRAPDHARDTLGRIRAEINDGAFDPGNYTARDQHELRWQNYCRAWLKAEEARAARGELAESSLRMYGAHLRNHVQDAPELRNRDIREIRGNHLQAFRDSLDTKGLSGNTVANVMAVLRRIFSDAYRLDNIERKPKLPTVHRPDPVHYRPSEEERDAVFQKLNVWNRPIFTFLRYQPARMVEACRLQRQHLHLDAEQPWVEIPKRIRKRGKSYGQPLHPLVAEMLRSSPPAGLFVFTHRDGRPYTSDQLGKIWRRAREKAGRPEATLYEATRHMIATDAANRGEDIGRIAAALGNTVQMTAKHYVTYRPGTIAGVILPPPPESAPKERPQTGPKG